MIFACIIADIGVISNTGSDSVIFAEQSLVSQPSDPTRNVAQSVNYKIKQKQGDFEWNAKKILGFQRFLSKIRDIEKNRHRK